MYAKLACSQLGHTPSLQKKKKKSKKHFFFLCVIVTLVRKKFKSKSQQCNVKSRAGSRAPRLCFDDCVITVFRKHTHIHTQKQTIQTSQKQSYDYTVHICIRFVESVYVNAQRSALVYAVIYSCYNCVPKDACDGS